MLEVAPFVGGGATDNDDQADVPATRNVDEQAARLLQGVLTASRDLDPVGVQSQLDVAAKMLGLAGCIDQIVLPASRQFADLLAAGQRDVAQDLLAVEAVRSWLSLRGSFAPLPRDVGPILLACGPRDRDLIGLESLALLLRYRTYPCWLLGARVSPFTLTIAAQAAAATGVVVMSAGRRGLPHAVVSLGTADAAGYPVFFAGKAFELEPIRRQAPGRYLGTSIAGACDLLIDTLSLGPDAAEPF